MLKKAPSIRRGSQVVRQRSAKPLFTGSTPVRASNLSVAPFLILSAQQPQCPSLRDRVFYSKSVLSIPLPPTQFAGTIHLVANPFTAFEEKLSYGPRPGLQTT